MLVLKILLGGVAVVVVLFGLLWLNAIRASFARNRELEPFEGKTPEQHVEDLHRARTTTGFVVPA